MSKLTKSPSKQKQKIIGMEKTNLPMELTQKHGSVTTRNKIKRTDDSDSDSSVPDARRCKPNCSSERYLNKHIESFTNQMKSMQDMLQTWKSEHDSRLSQMQSDMNDIKSQMSEIKNTNREIERSINFLSSKHDEMDAKIGRLTNDNKEYHTKILFLENKVEEITRLSCINKVEIRNIPCKSDETHGDLLNITQNLSSTLQLNTLTSEIRDVYRLPGKDSKKTIVLELSNKNSKDHLINAVRKYNAANIGNKLNTTVLKIGGTATPVYISECLTPTARKLFYLAREHAKKHQFKYVWTANGKVFMRKCDGEQHIYIKEEGQLKENLSA